MGSMSHTTSLQSNKNQFAVTLLLKFLYWLMTKTFALLVQVCIWGFAAFLWVYLMVIKWTIYTLMAVIITAFTIR